MQPSWDVNSAHVHVVEHSTVLAVQECPLRPPRKRKTFFEKIRTRMVSLFWL